VHVKPWRKAVAQSNAFVATHKSTVWELLFDKLLLHVSLKEPEPMQTVDHRQLACLATHQGKRPRGPKEDLTGVHVLGLASNGLA